MPAQPGDTIYNLIWKLVEAVSGIPRPGDSQRDLLAKYLTAIGGTPIPGDTFYDLLVKILRAKGGTPRPGDNEWLLLVHWLQIEGECRKCGDSIYDLWRKILALPGATMTASYSVSQDTMHLEWTLTGFETFDLESRVNGGAWTPLGSAGGSSSDFPDWSIFYGFGLWEFRVRGAGDLGAWIMSNSVTV